MKRRILFLLFISIFILSLDGCKSNVAAPDKNGVGDNKTQNKLDVNSYIPDINKIYTYKSITGEGQNEIKVSFELVEKGKYKRIETLDNEYKISEIYKVETDTIALMDYSAENYGSERVHESMDKGSRIVLKGVEPGGTWENKYAVKREINSINYYNGSESCTFAGYEKINAMNREMDAAVIEGSETLTDQGNAAVEKVNIKLWIVKDIGPVRYEIEKINGENRFNASFELISISDKKQ